MRRFFNAHIVCLLSIIFFIFSGCSPRGIQRSYISSGEISIHFIDVGQGDCTLIMLPGGRNILIDAGGPESGASTAGYLRSLDIQKIDHMIFTHPHDDHIGGIGAILSEFDVGNFYDNGFSNFDSPVYPDYVSSVREDLTRYHILQASESLKIGRAEIEILNPVLPPTGNPNEDSIVLRMTYGNIRILFAGDMGLRGEKRLLDSRTVLQSHVLKAAHHGDSDSTSEAFLKQAAPETAIISVAAVNKYGRPHTELLKRLKRAGATIYRTDQDGHITLRTDGKTYTIHPETMTK